MSTYDFGDNLRYSQGVSQRLDRLTLRALIDGCVNVTKTGVALDKRGVDYIATLRSGREISIDAKTRRRGISHHWHSTANPNSEPEVALEVWSVIPNSHCPTGKPGWTLNEKSPVELILFSFHPADHRYAYLFPFQQLRMAFRRHAREWVGKPDHKWNCTGGRYRTGRQSTPHGQRGWESLCVFVPISVVEHALRQTYRGLLVTGQEEIAS